MTTLPSESVHTFFGSPGHPPSPSIPAPCGLVPGGRPAGAWRRMRHQGMGSAVASHTRLPLAAIASPSARQRVTCPAPWSPPASARSSICSFMTKRQGGSRTTFLMRASPTTQCRAFFARAFVGRRAAAFGLAVGTKPSPRIICEREAVSCAALLGLCGDSSLTFSFHSVAGWLDTWPGKRRRESKERWEEIVHPTRRRTRPPESDWAKGRTEKQLSARISRHLRRLRDHGLVKKVPRRRCYPLTATGRQFTTALLALLSCSTESPA